MIQELYVDKESAERREKEIERMRKEKKETPLDIEYFSKRKGKLPWPVSGTIISKFGEKKVMSHHYYTLQNVKQMILEEK